MIAELFKRRSISPATHTVPDDQRIYAVGDVHGRLDLLDDLLEMIADDGAARSGKHVLDIRGIWPDQPKATANPEPLRAVGA